MTYTKYSASGNDFIISHSFIQKNFKKDAINLCNRTEGIGADGFVVLLPSNKANFKWQFYNNDGSCANMCGNAARAVAHYAHNNNLAPSQMKFETEAGLIKACVDGNIVETQMTKAILMKEEFQEESYKWILLDTGVPHLVSFVDDLEMFDLKLCSKMRCKYNANVNFAKIENETIKTRTYERGVEGETLACGTGMVACFLRANQLGLIKDTAFIYPKSNEQLIISKKDEELYFKGAVKKVFTAIVG